MRNSKYAIFAFAAGFVLTNAGCAAPRRDSERLANSSDIQRAINKEICFDYFWNGARYKLGATASITLAQGPNQIDAWSDSLLRMQDRFVSHFVIKSDRGKTFVASSESYNERIFPNIAGKTRSTISTRLRTPTNCEPDKATDSAKTRLIEAIAFRELAQIDSLAHRKSAKSIVIANVDDSYPRSFVYVPSTGELFSIAIPPGTSYAYTVDGPYLFGQILGKDHVAATAPKVVKYGLEVRMPESPESPKRSLRSASPRA